MIKPTKTSGPSEESDQRVHQIILKRAFVVRLFGSPGFIFIEIKFESY